MLKMRSVDSSTNQNSLIKLDGSKIDFTMEKWSSKFQPQESPDQVKVL